MLWLCRLVPALPLLAVSRRGSPAAPLGALAWGGVPARGPTWKLGCASGAVLVGRLGKVHPPPQWKGRWAVRSGRAGPAPLTTLQDFAHVIFVAPPV